MSESQKIALVTGANKGIGKAMVDQLAAKGFTVFLGARSRERGAAAAGELRAARRDIRAIDLDVTDATSIAVAAARIEREVGHLDLLVNNAGVVYEGAGPATVDVADVRRTYEVNIVGPIAVTQAMLPLLESGSLKVIANMSSELGSLTLHGDPAFPFGGFIAFSYNSSKTALNAFTVLLAKELAGRDFRVVAINPGFTATDLNGHAGPQSTDQAAGIAIDVILSKSAAINGAFLGGEGRLPW